MSVQDMYINNNTGSASKLDWLVYKMALPIGISCREDDKDGKQHFGRVPSVGLDGYGSDIRILEASLGYEVIIVSMKRNIAGTHHMQLASVMVAYDKSDDHYVSLHKHIFQLAVVDLTLVYLAHLLDLQLKYWNCSW